MDPQRLAHTLGWVSVGLGVAGTVMPRQTARLIGVRDRGLAPAIIRLVGARELVSGVGILAQTRPARWLWARVAGDAMDLMLLGAGFMSPRADKARLVTATAAIAGLTALDVIDAGELSRGQGTNLQPSQHAAAVRRAVTIGRPAEELYRFWRDFGNMPQFMERVESVQVRSERESHWRARGPGGAAVEWDSEVIEDRPNQLISWQTRPGARVAHEGTVRFQRAPGDRGTEVIVELEYTPPAGIVGAQIAKLLGLAPDKQLARDLRRFKQLMEIGEIPVSEGLPEDAAGRPRPVAATGGAR